ncbi:hypothetical protein L9F63_020376, partial [Diploptera punctata]
FQSVECVNLQLDFNPEMVEYILTQCHNLKRAEVTIEIGNDNVIINSVLSRNSFKHLQEFNWWSTSDMLSRDTAIQIIQHCPKLEVLRGPFVWTRHGNLQQLDRHTKNRFSYVNTTVLRV